jgi:Cache domain
VMRIAGWRGCGERLVPGTTSNDTERDRLTENRGPPVRRLLASPRRSVFLLTVVALAVVALLAVSSIVLASDQVTSVVDKQVRTTAAVSSVTIGQQTAELVDLLHSYATRPSLASGMAAGARGAAVVAFDLLANLARALPGISASFVTDLHGTSLSTYPPEPSVYGTNFAYREWFKGVVATGRAFVSDAIETKEASHALAITVTDYIRAPDGRPVGILGVNYSLQSIRSFALHAGRAQGITLSVTDHAGTSLTAGSSHGLVSLAGDPRVGDGRLRSDQEAANRRRNRPPHVRDCGDRHGDGGRPGSLSGGRHGRLSGQAPQPAIAGRRHGSLGGCAI